MGKKIKPHKHFGDRDPLKQRDEREKKLVLEKKINHPPKFADDQEVSKSFKKFMKLKEDAVKSGNINKKRKLVTIHDDFTKGDKLSKRMSNESNRQHLRRVERIIETKKAEADYAKKYNVKIIRDESSGSIKIKKDPAIRKPKIDKKKIQELIKEKKQASAETKSKEGEEKKLTIVQYQSHENKKKRDLEDDIIKLQQNAPKFGEVVKEPPSFNFKQKPNTNASKTGRRDFLFLSKLKST